MSADEGRAAGWDIDHNRAGRLSPAQAEVVRKTKLTGLLLYAGVPMITVQIGLDLIQRGFEARHGVGLGVLMVLAGVAILAGTGVGATYWWRRKGVLRHENVTFVDGHVVWAGSPRTWTPVRPSGVPFAFGAGGSLLPPGAYRFYVHEDGIVAADSPLDPTTHWSITQSSAAVFQAGLPSTLPPAPLPVGDPEALRAALRETLGFTDEDLAHQRQGELSPRQGGGRVDVVEGPLAVGSTMHGSGAHHAKLSATYWWEVGGRRFEVPLAWQYAVPPGVACRCYVDERSQRIVSMEPIVAGDRKEA